MKAESSLCVETGKGWCHVWHLNKLCSNPALPLQKWNKTFLQDGIMIYFKHIYSFKCGDFLEYDIGGHECKHRWQAVILMKTQKKSIAWWYTTDTQRADCIKSITSTSGYIIAISSLNGKEIYKWVFNIHSGNVPVIQVSPNTLKVMIWFVAQSVVWSFHHTYLASVICKALRYYRL